MDFFFKPKGVAVIGATGNKNKVGYSIVKNLTMGYKGEVYPVNPKYDEIEGMPCYPSVEEVPDPVDLAIIFVPASKVPDIVKQCAGRGIKGVMIQSAGFAEVGKRGIALQEELVQIAREKRIRVWGPNCMGLVDAVNKNVFSFVSPSIWDDGLLEGNVSLIVQSGLLSAGFLIDMMSHGTMGISKACSIGNKADVDECDVLEYLIGDPQTGAVGLYVEAVANGKRFLELCRQAEKPIVVLKGGKSAGGARAAMSHTAPHPNRQKGRQTNLYLGLGKKGRVKSFHGGDSTDWHTYLPGNWPRNRCHGRSFTLIPQLEMPALGALFSRKLLIPSQASPLRPAQKNTCILPNGQSEGLAPRHRASVKPWRGPRIRLKCSLLFCWRFASP